MCCRAWLPFDGTRIARPGTVGPRSIVATIRFNIDNPFDTVKIKQDKVWTDERRFKPGLELTFGSPVIRLIHPDRPYPETCP